MKEKILNTLKTLGFNLEQVENFGYLFKYEGINYVWMTETDDDKFLSIVIPGILEKPDGESISFYKLVDGLNSSLKYVKACVVSDSIWLVYEHELFEDEDVERLISRMIVHLDAAIRIFHNRMEELVNGEDENNGDNETTEK